ncbi:hypothetical protein SADUNF_Sadunf19G0067000 [Salix dunnii]|uniref:Uncharacterized protein n=1 Tax=Salix dunnii TaxID=1413687 RepID=A0A835J246_9ROSI|nr:hypothetical protein SADUNF_Sadunf19G0067000 [Salix dunnii]
MEEWEKDLVIKNQHNLKQLIVLMWDLVPFNNEVKRNLTLISFFLSWGIFSPACTPASLVTSEVWAPNSFNGFQRISSAAEYYLHKLRSARTEKRNLKPHNLLFSFHLQLLKHQKP